jgi:hypothetical protein
LSSGGRGRNKLMTCRWRGSTSWTESRTGREEHLYRLLTPLMMRS